MWQNLSGERLTTVRLGRCAVCQMEFEAGDEVSTLPCSHFYHPDCIGQWLKDRKVRAASQLHGRTACLLWAPFDIRLDFPRQTCEPFGM